MKDYFKFDTTPINPNPPIPKEIERAAVQYKKDGEMESVGPFKVVTSNKYYYHCNNELIAISDQNNYEYPPINVQKLIKA